MAFNSNNLSFGFSQDEFCAGPTNPEEESPECCSLLTVCGLCKNYVCKKHCYLLMIQKTSFKTQPPTRKLSRKPACSICYHSC